MSKGNKSIPRLGNNKRGPGRGKRVNRSINTTPDVSLLDRILRMYVTKKEVSHVASEE